MITDDIIEQLKYILDFKKRMLADDCYHGKIKCPKCGVRGALHARISHYNKHIHAACQEDGCGFIMME